MLRIFFNRNSGQALKLVCAAYALSAFFFFEAVCAETTPKAPLETKDLLEFVENIQNKSLRVGKKVEKAKAVFYQGQKLPSNYRWIFKDYKVDSRDGMIEYVFLNEEAFGHVRWKIEMHVQDATLEIIFFSATALKEAVAINN